MQSATYIFLKTFNLVCKIHSSIWFACIIQSDEITHEVKKSITKYIHKV